MYLNLDLLCCEDSDCSRAIAECKRMRKADLQALTTWAITWTLVITVLMTLDFIKAPIQLSELALTLIMVGPSVVPAFMMLRAGTLGIVTSVWMKLWTIVIMSGIFPFIGWCFVGVGGLLLLGGILFSVPLFGVYPLIDILGLSIKLGELKQRHAAFEGFVWDNETAQAQSKIPPQAAPQNADLAPNFFAGCSTFEQVKARYKALCKAYHPDTGNGDTETLQTINSQYEGLIAQYHG